MKVLIRPLAPDWKDPALKGLRWALLKDRDKLGAEQRSDLDALVAQYTSKRTARAWLYREQLRDILNRKQINVVSTMLGQWCTNVMRSDSKVEPIKKRSSHEPQPLWQHRRLDYRLCA